MNALNALEVAKLRSQPHGETEPTIQLSLERAERGDGGCVKALDPKAAPVVPVRPLNVIAREIRTDWGRAGKGVNYAAAPYLEAMARLWSIKEDYYQDSGASVVRGFLGNAGTWRGDVARRVKAELKAILEG